MSNELLNCTSHLILRQRRKIQRIFFFRDTSLQDQRLNPVLGTKLFTANPQQTQRMEGGNSHPDSE
ncbi:hypothetical protein D3C78_1813680 [compost metagenome]